MTVTLTFSNQTRTSTISGHKHGHTLIPISTLDMRVKMVVQNEVERTFVLLDTPVQRPRVRGRVDACPATPPLVLLLHLPHNAQLLRSWYHRPPTAPLLPSLIHIR